MKPARLFYRRSFYRLLTILSGMAILTMSSVPNLPQPEIQASGQVFRLDYFFHFLVYFFPAITAVIWFSDRDGLITSRNYIILLLAGVLFGCIDEIHQIYIPGRRFNPMDLILNVAGFVSGAIFTYHWLIRHLLIRKNRFPRMRKNLFDQSI